MPSVRMLQLKEAKHTTQPQPPSGAVTVGVLVSLEDDAADPLVEQADADADADAEAVMDAGADALSNLSLDTAGAK